MANNTISQIKLGTTTYDICDYTARNNFLIPRVVNCTLNADQSISATSNKNITWSTKDQTVTDWIYFGYLHYNTASQNVYVVTFTENGMNLFNKGTSAVTVRPTATQLYMNPTL